MFIFDPVATLPPHSLPLSPRMQPPGIKDLFTDVTFSRHIAGTQYMFCEWKCFQFEVLSDCEHAMWKLIRLLS